MLTRSSLLMATLLIAISPLSVIAQTMEDSLSLTFEAPAGMQSAAQAEMMVSSTRDENFNKVVTNSPHFGASASAIGNLVNVVTQGSNNTIVVNASQVNYGSQKATTIASPLGHSNDTSSQTYETANKTVSFDQ